MSDKQQGYSPNLEDLENWTTTLEALIWIRQYCVITKDENIDKQLIIAKCKEVLEDE